MLGVIQAEMRAPTDQENQLLNSRAAYAGHAAWVPLSSCWAPRSCRFCVQFHCAARGISLARLGYPEFEKVRSAAGSRRGSARIGSSPC